MVKKSNRIFEDLIPLFKDLVWLVGVVIALVVFYYFLFLIVGLKNFVPLINGLAWPTVVVIVLIVFRKPLTDFLRGITGRVTKFSITQIFSVELSLPEASHPMVDQNLPGKLQELASGEVTSDSLKMLLEEIKSDKSLDYMIIDLGKGQEWLTSRLFILTLMLERMRGLRCLVFLRTHHNVPRSFVGIAFPGEVRWALARKYSWLEEAYVRAQLELYEGYKSSQLPVPILSKQGALDPFDASRLSSSFLGHIQARVKKEDPSPNPPSEWTFLKKGLYWEHANWIDKTCLETDLGDALRKSDDAWFKDSPDISQVRRVQAVLRRKGAFTTLIDGERLFKSLIDRKALLEQVAERAGKVSDD